MNTERNVIIDFIRKQWLLLWIIIAALSIVTMSVSALYESTANSLNRVVVASSSEGMRFSSNLLEVGGEKAYQAAYRQELADGDKATSYYPVEVYIYNYDLTNSVKRYPETIYYNLKVKLTNTIAEALTADDIESGKAIEIWGKATPDATEDIRLFTLDKNNRDHVFTNEQLVNNPVKASENRYTLRFSGNWDLDEDTDVCVQMIAEPQKNEQHPYNDLESLAQIIGVKRAIDSESKGWSAYLKEKREGRTLSSCDGYNLVVTGSGKATIVIEWDSSKVDFDRNFYMKDTYLYPFNEVTYTPPTQSNTWAKMVIVANTGSNATNHRNRYDVQLYKKAVEPGDWNFIVDMNDTSITEDVKAAAWVKTSVTMTAS